MAGPIDSSHVGHVESVPSAVRPPTVNCCQLLQRFCPAENCGRITCSPACAVVRIRPPRCVHVLTVKAFSDAGKTTGIAPARSPEHGISTLINDLAKYAVRRQGSSTERSSIRLLHYRPIPWRFIQLPSVRRTGDDFRARRSPNPACRAEIMKDRHTDLLLGDHAASLRDAPWTFQPAAVGNSD